MGYCYYTFSDPCFPSLSFIRYHNPNKCLTQHLSLLLILHGKVFVHISSIAIIFDFLEISLNTIFLYYSPNFLDIFREMYHDMYIFASKHFIYLYFFKDTTKSGNILSIKLNFSCQKPLFKYLQMKINIFICRCLKILNEPPLHQRWEC